MTFMFEVHVDQLYRRWRQRSHREPVASSFYTFQVHHSAPGVFPFLIQEIAQFIRYVYQAVKGGLKYNEVYAL